MNPFNLFAWFFQGGHVDHPQQQPQPDTETRRMTVNIPKHIELEISKAIEQLVSATVASLQAPEIDELAAAVKVDPRPAKTAIVPMKPVGLADPSNWPSSRMTRAAKFW